MSRIQEVADARFQAEWEQFASDRLLDFEDGEADAFADGWQRATNIIRALIEQQPDLVLDLDAAVERMKARMEWGSLHWPDTPPDDMLRALADVVMLSGLSRKDVEREAVVTALEALANRTTEKLPSLHCTGDRQAVRAEAARIREEAL